MGTEEEIKEARMEEREGIHNKTHSLHPFPFADNQAPFIVRGNDGGIKRGAAC